MFYCLCFSQRKKRGSWIVVEWEEEEGVGKVVLEGTCCFEEGGLGGQRGGGGGGAGRWGGVGLGVRGD